MLNEEDEKMRVSLRNFGTLVIRHFVTQIVNCQSLNGKYSNLVQRLALVFLYLLEMAWT